MDQSKNLADAQKIPNTGRQRRSFLKVVGGGILGASAMAVGAGKVYAASAKKYEPRWQSGLVLIGHSIEPQKPSLYIECPMFFANGHYADASYSLDLTNLETTGEVLSTITYNDETVIPDFGDNMAATPAVGADGVSYVLVGGKGTISGGTGFFESIDTAIIRCKYEVVPASALLIRCIDCVVILVRS